MASSKVVLIKNNKDDNYGYLKIRVINNRKVKLKSLGIKVLEKDFNTNKQRVRTSAPLSDNINIKIEEVLSELSNFNNQIQAIQSTRTTVLNYFDEVISITINNGTRLKKKGIRNMFEAYLNSIGLDDIKFEELNQLHIQSYFKFIRENGSAKNTANHNIKGFKSVINKAIKAGIIRYYTNPFDGLKLKYDEKQKEALESNDIQRIVNKLSYDDSRKKTHYNYSSDKRFVSYDEIASIFLFQFNMQGMRCSDMQLLRWSNFKIKNGLLLCDYSMIKTGKEMTITLTPFALECMKYSIFNLIPRMEEDYNEIKLSKENILNRKEEPSDKNIKAIEELNVKLYKFMGAGVHLYSTNDKYKNQFVFPFLSSGDFKEYFGKPILRLNANQHKKMTSTNAYYNKLLKVIQKQNNIQTTITTHTARHSYTTILVENDVSLTEISATLGHKHISTTQSYISRLNISNIYDLNDGISRMFYK